MYTCPCQAGRQRSATVVAAFVSKMCHTDCDEAMMMVKVKKIEAFFPAPNFLAVLQSFVSGMDRVKWF